MLISTWVNAFHLHKVLGGRYYYSLHFTAEETEAVGAITHSRPSLQGALRTGCDPSGLAPEPALKITRAPSV